MRIYLLCLFSFSLSPTFVSYRGRNVFSTAFIWQPIQYQACMLDGQTVLFLVRLCWFLRFFQFRSVDFVTFGFSEFFIKSIRIYTRIHRHFAYFIRSLMSLEYHRSAFVYSACEYASIRKGKKSCVSL